MANPYNLKDPEEVKEYLKNLHIEYKFGCYSEKNAEACHLLGDYEESIKQDYKEAAKVYKMNCDTLNYGKSCTKYGDFSLVGRGCDKNAMEAYKYMKKGCDQNDARGCYHAGVLAATNDELEKDRAVQVAEGIRMLQKACDANDEKACFHLSGIFIAGIKGFVEKDFPRSYKLAMKSCDSGNPYACANLSVMHRNGDGVEKSDVMAETFKNKAMKLLHELQTNKRQLKFHQGIESFIKISIVQRCTTINIYYSERNVIIQVEVHWRCFDSQNYFTLSIQNNLDFASQDDGEFVFRKCKGINLSVLCDKDDIGQCHRFWKSWEQMIRLAVSPIMLQAVWRLATRHILSQRESRIDQFSKTLGRLDSGPRVPRYSNINDLIYLQMIIFVARLLPKAEMIYRSADKVRNPRIYGEVGRGGNTGRMAVNLKRRSLHHSTTAIMRCHLFAFCWALLVVLTFIGQKPAVTADEVSNKIDVDVYYESLCPDSKRWIRVQLAESYHVIKDYIRLNLIPYGKATQLIDSSTGQWAFSCQHGPDECDGNKAQACAIHAIKNEEPADRVQQLTESVVVCAMSTRFPPTEVEKCAEKLWASQKTQDIIRDCIAGPLSSELLAEHGKKTAALKLPISFVPTIVINGVYSKENQNKAYNNFLKLICDNLQVEAKPAECSAA
ncbi:uncharacterized protein LOC143354682 [Halictus rubicundus]|uniref:uncharacterized protein LOC143354682 n=1 Tax=Halictus rubicundus TaxID=77578 RepID=UPI004036D4C6